LTNSAQAATTGDLLNFRGIERMGMLEGRVALCTGAGRGVGGEVAKLMAAHGAKVVVNDPGTSGSGEGSDQTPAQEIVDQIKSASVVSRLVHRSQRPSGLIAKPGVFAA